MKRDDENGIDERSFRFFRDVLAYVETIPLGPRVNALVEQLVDAAGSIGGNREEALGGSTRREFARYNEIALRGANETVRWLRSALQDNWATGRSVCACSTKAVRLPRSSRRS